MAPRGPLDLIDASGRYTLIPGIGVFCDEPQIAMEDPPSPNRSQIQGIAMAALFISSKSFLSSGSGSA